MEKLEEHKAKQDREDKESAEKVKGAGLAGLEAGVPEGAEGTPEGKYLRWREKMKVGLTLPGTRTWTKFTEPSRSACRRSKKECCLWSNRTHNGGKRVTT